MGDRVTALLSPADGDQLNDGPILLVALSITEAPRQIVVSRANKAVFISDTVMRILVSLGHKPPGPVVVRVKVVVIVTA